MKKILILSVLTLIEVLIAQVNLPNTFPSECYTPHGYIDNPYRSMVLNRSGVIRSFPPLGFGFWLRNFPGSYGGGVKNYVNYISLIHNALSVDENVIINEEDFSKFNINLCSEYHTKNMISYDFKFKNTQFSFKFFLFGENSLVCVVEIRNNGNENREIYLYSTHIYGMWEEKWWGSDGVSSKFDTVNNVNISKIWAYGDVFSFGSNVKPVARNVFKDKMSWIKWLRDNNKISNFKYESIKGDGPLYTTLVYKVIAKPQSFTQLVISLTRAPNESKAIKNLISSLHNWKDSLDKKLNEDELFWKECPTLIGDWPKSWKRGWVYDFETLRMNVRKPIGIFKYPWDAMQIHSPRVVLAETSIDMLALSYVQPELAKEVIAGTFLDALAPNVPCSREDGSVNMISSDGSECGTAPMWCFPFKTIRSIFLREKDTTWIEKLYPYLKSYIIWWLNNRTVNEWLTVNNSWESGQDISKRFLREGKTEGDVVNFVAAVDVEASIIEAMKILKTFSELLKLKSEIPYWDSLIEKRMKKINAMFSNNWFWDVDIRSGNLIKLDYYDVMQLSPVACNIATPIQINSIKWSFNYFLKNINYLEWPPFLLTFTEAAWNANERFVPSEIVSEIATRTYQRIDSRKVLVLDPSNLIMYRIPGIACEFWPSNSKNPGAEAYGWGATLPIFIIRDILGIREKEPNPDSDFEFFLSPTFDAKFQNKNIGISNLNMYNYKIELLCEPIGSEIKTSIKINGEKPFYILITDENGKIISRQNNKLKEHILSLSIVNGRKYIVKIKK